jgi:small-conductance mechanosensitive channel
MLMQTSTAIPGIDDVLRQFVADVVGVLPRLLSGALFLVVAYVAIKLVLVVVRSVTGRLYPADEALIAELVVAVVGIVLWFGAMLALLKIVGLGDIATSLGTATGFVALGVAFALKEMIADTVAGVYLLQDPDFNPGDAVETASVTGTVAAIDLRKTRIDLDGGDRVVVANRDVEKKWTRRGGEDG